MNIAQVAQAFASKKAGKSHNSHTDGVTYFLHGHPIATHESAERVYFNWCGWFTPTTANHLNHIKAALNAPGQRFGYASARDSGTCIGYF